MDARLFWQGIVIGFSIAAPVGPIAILCIRRTLAQGRLCGLVSGLGGATADAFYAGIAAFGVTIVSDLLIRQTGWLRIGGGLLLLYLGIRTILSHAGGGVAPAQSRSLLGAYSSTFALTLTNPMTVLYFAAIFTGVGLGASSGDYLSSAILVLGVFGGSAAWWIFLSMSTGLLSDRLTPATLTWINRLSGIVILAFAVIVLAGLWR